MAARRLTPQQAKEALAKKLENKRAKDAAATVAKNAAKSAATAGGLDTARRSDRPVRVAADRAASAGASSGSVNKNTAMVAPGDVDEVIGDYKAKGTRHVAVTAHDPAAPRNTAQTNDLQRGPRARQFDPEQSSAHSERTANTSALKMNPVPGTANESRGVDQQYDKADAAKAKVDEIKANVKTNIPAAKIQYDKAMARHVNKQRKHDANVALGGEERPGSTYTPPSKSAPAAPKAGSLGAGLRSGEASGLLNLRQQLAVHEPAEAPAVPAQDYSAPSMERTMAGGRSRFRKVMNDSPEIAAQAQTVAKKLTDAQATADNAQASAAVSKGKFERTGGNYMRGNNGKTAGAVAVPRGARRAYPENPGGAENQAIGLAGATYKDHRSPMHDVRDLALAEHTGNPDHLLRTAGAGDNSWRTAGTPKSASARVAAHPLVRSLLDENRNASNGGTASSTLRNLAISHGLTVKPEHSARDILGMANKSIENTTTNVKPMTKQSEGGTRGYFNIKQPSRASTQKKADTMASMVGGSAEGHADELNAVESAGKERQANVDAGPGTPRSAARDTARSALGRKLGVAPQRGRGASFFEGGRGQSPMGSSRTHTGRVPGSAAGAQPRSAESHRPDISSSASIADARFTDTVRPLTDVATKNDTTREMKPAVRVGVKEGYDEPKKKSNSALPK